MGTSLRGLLSNLWDNALESARLDGEQRRRRRDMGIDSEYELFEMDRRTRFHS